MSVVRMNITLPEELARQIDKLVEPRKKSQFIAETLQQRIERIQHEKLQKILEEGYKARKKESQSLTKEFEYIDLEGWDEY
jgi:metal-responsive CopG/Arc/MetJ family transcriptional regulator